jgi:hypothetical protein
MTQDGNTIIDVTDLLRADLDHVDSHLGGIVSLPNMTSGRLRVLLDAAAAPAQDLELDGEASVRRAFREASTSSGWRRVARRGRRRVAIVAVATTVSLVGASTGLAAVALPVPAAKVVHSLFGAASPPAPTSRPTATATATSTSVPTTVSGSGSGGRSSPGPACPSGVAATGRHCNATHPVGSGSPGTAPSTPPPNSSNTQPALPASGTGGQNSGSGSGSGSSGSGSPTKGVHHGAGGSGSGGGSNRGGFGGAGGGGGGKGGGGGSTTTTTTTTTSTTTTTTTTTPSGQSVAGNSANANCNGSGHHHG